MIAWTVTAEPLFVPTASSSKQEYTSVDDITDDPTGGEIKLVATGSTRAFATGSTDSIGNAYASASYESANSNGESFYVSGTLQEEVTSSGSSTGQTYITQSWDGQRTESIANIDTTYVSYASSSTAPTTRDTSTTISGSGFSGTTTTVTATAITGTTYSSGGITYPSTTTAAATITSAGGGTATTAITTVTQFTTSVSQWAMSVGGESWYPTFSTKTAMRLGDSVLWSVTSPNSGHFTNGANSYSGSVLLSSSRATRQGAVVTVNESSTFTATSFVSVTGTQAVGVTTARPTTYTIFTLSGAGLPLVSQTRSTTTRATTTSESQTQSFAATASSHLPTKSIVVAATKTFAANFEIAETFAVVTGTASGTTTATYSTAGSQSGTVTSGPSDFGGSPITNRTTTSSTSAVAWADTDATGYNFAYGNANQLSAAKFYPVAWAAASNFESAAQQIVCNIGTVTLPLPVRGGQSIYAFVGSATFSSDSRIFTASAEGNRVVVTTSNSTTQGTSSASIVTQGAAFTVAQNNNATTPGGRAGIGNVSVAILPGAYNTSDSAGNSGTSLNAGENLEVAASQAKTAALGRPFYVGSMGDITGFLTARNFNEI